VTEAAPSAEHVELLLRDLHGDAVEDLMPLAGGFWSTAYGYRLGRQELVLRLGDLPEGYEMDRDAMAFDGPDLPVPAVLDIGQALGRWYAVSERRHGRHLETIRPDEADVAGPAIMRLLAALRAVRTEPDAPAAWRPEGPPHESTWRRWLTDSLEDDPRRPVSGWRGTLAADADLDRLFTACADRVRSLVPSCPERRDVVHGDLLHGNVLVSEDASRISAVFSWKCSVRGDFLYDVAWCTFWGAWHPGIAAVDVWTRLLDHRPDEDPGALDDAAVRHHCYELQIGATHLGWYAWTGDRRELAAAARHTARILERGPLR
jgi:aminoglycoside phosphotransferase (APT) family kinase protein